MSFNSLRAYRRNIIISCLKGLEYRFGIIYILIEAIIPVTAMFFLWQAIYQDGREIGDYGFNQMITYYAFARIINYLIWFPMDWKMNDLVNQGKLSPLLSKPVDIQGLYFSEMIGDRIINFVLGCIPLFIMAFLFRDYLSFNTDPIQIFFGLVSICLACVLSFLLAWLVGCYVFWVSNIFSVLFVKELIVMIFAGVFFPIDILPWGLANFISLTPFPYLAFFPIKIITVSIETSSLMEGLLLQIIWIVILFVLGRIAWKMGLKKYVEAGG
ncbi:ABC transporter permease [Paenibacillus xylanexedens]|uniref:ABC transporter permease n=1 Tax=Paenibacillus xylanexedens TaxID=528191 RepID=UPI003CFEA723